MGGCIYGLLLILQSNIVKSFHNLPLNVHLFKALISERLN